MEDILRPSVTKYFFRSIVVAEMLFPSMDQNKMLRFCSTCLDTVQYNQVNLLTASDPC